LKPTSIDAGILIYGFIANIHFYDIDTPLKQFVASHPNLVRHCNSIHAAVGSTLRREDPISNLPNAGFALLNCSSFPEFQPTKN
jgi:hypothetical protein